MSRRVEGEEGEGKEGERKGKRQTLQLQQHQHHWCSGMLGYFDIPSLSIRLTWVSGDWL